MNAKTKKLSGIMLPAIDEALELEMKTKEQAQVAQTAEQESSLSERALLVRFSIGRWYGSGADEQVVNEIRNAKEATGEIGSFTKRLMKREHLAEINRVTSDARRYHKTMTLPWGESGQRVLSVEVYREYKEHMTKFEADFFKAVEAFVAKFPLLVEEEKRNLRGLWRAEDYPSAEDIRGYFRFGLAIDTLPRTHDMRLKLSKEQAEEIRVEIEQRMHGQIVGAVSEVYDRIAEELRGAKERMDDADARLQGRMFDGLKEVLTLLPKLNILKDPRLTQLGRDLQKEMATVSVDALRDDPAVRKQTSAKAGKMLDAIAKLKGSK